MGRIKNTQACTIAVKADRGEEIPWYSWRIQIGNFPRKLTFYKYQRSNSPCCWVVFPHSPGEKCFDSVQIFALARPKLCSAMALLPSAECSVLQCFAMNNASPGCTASLCCTMHRSGVSVHWAMYIVYLCTVCIVSIVCNHPFLTFLPRCQNLAKFSRSWMLSFFNTKGDVDLGKD